MFSYRIDDDTELRLPEERHVEEAFALTLENHGHLRAWLPWLRDDFSIEDTRHFIKQNLRQFADNKGFSVNVVFQGKIAGLVGYNLIDWSNRATELGYWIGAAYQGRGLITKSCRALIDHAFDNLKLNRVEISCGTENRRSRAIPERLGFTQEGIRRQAEWLHDHFVDLAIYGMLASDWQRKDLN